MEYIIKPSYIRDIVHSGKGHDDNPPGRGSGRYAWGSGKKGQRRKDKLIIGKTKYAPYKTENGKKIKMDPLLDRTIKKGKDKAPVSAAEELTRGARNTIGDVSNVARDIADLKQAKKNAERRSESQSKAKKMSDDELRKKINRLNLEKQYSDLTSRDVDLGRQKLDLVLDTSMSLANIAATAASVATVIWMIKKGAGV